MSRIIKRPPWNSERLAYWYFRLNGFLTTENFVIHPDTGRNQLTDADILAVRFAHRAENLYSPMTDDNKVARCSTFANIIIAEVKTGKCSMNGPWTDPSVMNMRRALKAIGCVPDHLMDQATEDLYNKGVWSEGVSTIRIFALGESKDSSLVIPKDQQITWDQVISFCVDRFKEYRIQKSSVGQWTADGRKLRTAALGRNAESEIRGLFNLNMPEHRGANGNERHQ